MKNLNYKGNIMKSVYMESTDNYTYNCSCCHKIIPQKTKYIRVCRGEYEYPITICFDCIKKMYELIQTQGGIMNIFVIIKNWFKQFNQPINFKKECLNYKSWLDKGNIK